MSNVIKIKHEPLRKIAREIEEHWPTINPAALSYLKAMATLDQIEDMYHLDTAESIVLRFLANASYWRGDKAKAIKLRLKWILEHIDKEVANANHRKAYA